MHLNAYLNFDGNCEAAFKFYEQCLGGKNEQLFGCVSGRGRDNMQPIGCGI